MQETPNTGAAGAQGDVDFAALPVGARVGRYEILEVLGQGGFGITYRARDEQLHRDVAIKEYLPASLAVRQDGSTVLPRSTKVAEDFSWGRERFVLEGRTLASLHDAPAIVRVFDFMELNGTAYIVMELVRGDTLERRLKDRGTLDADAVDTILWPLLDGLDQVHKAGFLHRDIKPANILLGAGGKPTLIDFGASRAAMAGRTTAMTAIFSPGYAAAEQFTSARQGAWTDIYGISATLYHAITGAPPPSAFDRMLDDAYQPLAKLAPPGFARGLLIGIDAGLAVRATERPQSIAGWRPLLSQTGNAASDATAVLAKPAPPRPPPVAAKPAAPLPTTSEELPLSAPAPAAMKRSRIGVYGAVAAVLLLVLGGGGYFLFTGKPALQTAMSIQDMKVEELEKVLDARRKADVEAVERRRQEEEARLKAGADTEAKRKADEELRLAEEQRRKAEAELATLREELEAQRRATAEQRELADATARRAAAEEARRKAEDEMVALRKAEDEARRKVAVEAEAKRLADRALARAQAERHRAEEDAKSKAEEEAKRKAEADSRTRTEAETRARAEADKAKAEADAKAQAEAEVKAKAEAERKAADSDKKTVEAAEAALRLGLTDRQRLQVALSALGFDTRGTDGAFGPRSREMIGAWQGKRNEPATGFLTAAQQQALLREAAPAVGKFNEEQKKLEEEKKKAEEEAKAKAAAAQTPPQPAIAPPQPAAPAPPVAAIAPPPAPTGGRNPYDGRWSGMANFGNGSSQPLSATLQNGTGKGSWRVGRCGTELIYTITVQPDGRYLVQLEGFNDSCARNTTTFTGTVQNNTVRFNFARGGANSFTISK
jgi:serine/threonine protein kinase/peptidoglycan hydrolase-like protein with peptidoglycan-binding domain